MIYAVASCIKNFLYEKNILKRNFLPIPVISVGNLTVGGTGKTAFIDWMLSEFSKTTTSVCVLSRGYKRKSKGIRKVNPEVKNSASIYGDEPTMLALKNKEASVMVGSDRYAAAQQFLRQNYPSVFVLDDGFQHRKLNRDLDILIMDATEKKSSYLTLPLGRARESLSSMKRADLIVITKSNLCELEDLEKLKSMITRYKDESATSILTEYRISNREALVRDEIDSYVLVSGIGRPKAFYNLVKQNLPSKIAKHHIFPDHYSYKPENLQNLINGLSEGEWILTTEKDYVKLKELDADLTKVLQCKLEFYINDLDRRRILETINRLIG